MKKKLLLAMAIMCLLFVYHEWGRASEERKEIPTQSESQTSVLTEEEQEEFSRWRGKWDGRILNEENALKYLSILVRGKNTVKWYSDRELWGTGTFEDDVCTLVDYLASFKSKEGYKLVMQILENPDEWVSNLKCVLRSMKSFDMKESIPLLRKYLSYKLPREKFPEHEKSTRDLEVGYRLEAAGTLLVLGDADTALPVLEDLLKEGNTYAIPYLFKSGWGKPWKLWDERGVEIIKRALGYPENKIKAEAALFLCQIGIEKEKSEEVALAIIEILKDKTAIDYGLSLDKVPNKLTPAEERFYNDGISCDYAMEALSIIKSKKAISPLKQISERNIKWWNVCWKRRADEALKKIQENSNGGTR